MITRSRKKARTNERENNAVEFAFADSRDGRIEAAAELYRTVAPGVYFTKVDALTRVGVRTPDRGAVERLTERLSSRERRPSRGDWTLLERAARVASLVVGLPRVTELLQLAGCVNEETMASSYIKVRDMARKLRRDRLAARNAAHAEACAAGRREGRVTVPHCPNTEDLLDESIAAAYEYEVTAGDCFNIHDILLDFERRKMKAEAKALTKIKQSLAGGGAWTPSLEAELQRLRRGEINLVQEDAIYGQNSGALDWIAIRPIHIPRHRLNLLLDDIFEEMPADEREDVATLFSEHWCLTKPIQITCSEEESVLWQSQVDRLKSKFFSISRETRKEYLKLIFDQLDEESKDEFVIILRANMKANAEETSV